MKQQRRVPCVYFKMHQFIIYRDRIPTPAKSSTPKSNSDKKKKGSLNPRACALILRRLVVTRHAVDHSSHAPDDADEPRAVGVKFLPLLVEGLGDGALPADPADGGAHAAARGIDLLEGI